MRVEQVDLDVARAVGDRAGVAAREIVEHDDLVAGVEQLLGDDGADVARPARDQELHGRPDPRMERVRMRVTAVLLALLTALGGERSGARPGRAPRGAGGR